MARPPLLLVLAIITTLLLTLGVSGYDLLGQQNHYNIPAAITTYAGIDQYSFVVDEAGNMTRLNIMAMALLNTPTTTSEKLVFDYAITSGNYTNLTVGPVLCGGSFNVSLATLTMISLYCDTEVYPNVTYWLYLSGFTPGDNVDPTLALTLATDNPDNLTASRKSSTGQLRPEIDLYYYVMGQKTGNNQTLPPLPDPCPEGVGIYDDPVDTPETYGPYTQFWTQLVGNSMLIILIGFSLVIGITYTIHKFAKMTIVTILGAVLITWLLAYIQLLPIYTAALVTVCAIVSGIAGSIFGGETDET